MYIRRKEKVIENRYLFRAKRIDNGEWVEGYCSLLGEYGKKFEAVCAMLALDLIGVKVFKYSDETAEAVASGEKLLKESQTVYESFADMMSPDDAAKYLDVLENGSV